MCSVTDCDYAASGGSLKCNKHKRSPEGLIAHQRRKTEARTQLRADVLAAYGGSCSCCGERTEQFLTVDHVDGGGIKHRKSIGGGGDNLYRWLRRMGWPPGFQILCWNCNCGRQLNGGVCPHQTAPAVAH